MAKLVAIAGLALVVACARPAVAPIAPAPACTPLATGDDLSDLAPLGELVGDARVVALGEASHADGGAFVVKARLARWLHEKKGFDVLAFESSLWACESKEVDCLAWPWSGVKEVDAVRAWAGASGVTVTGFDPQLTGGAERLGALERWVVKRLSPPPPLEARLHVAFARYPKMGKFRSLTIEERATDEAALRELRALALALGAADPLPLRVIDDVLVTYAWHAAVGADRSTTIDWDGHAENNDVRDRGMADDVRWLLDVRHPGKKLVLWLATSHAQKAPASVAYPGYAQFHSMGSWLAAWLGRGYVAIGIGAQGGRLGNAPTPEQELLPLPADAIERACTSEVGLLRLSTQPAPGGFFGHQPMRAPWATELDAAIVVRTMTPASR